MESYKEEFFEARDGVKLYRRGWGKPDKGVVLIVHGFGEHIGRYNFLVDALSQRGYAVEGFDCRGHGKSGGPRGHVDRFSQYIDDLDLFFHLVQSEYPLDKPIFLLGHSQGGHVVLRYGIEFPKLSIAGMVTSSPFLGLTMKVPFLKVLASRLASRIWPTFSQPTGLDERFLTHDSQVVEETKRDPLYVRRATARWYQETLKAQAETLRRAPEFRYPLLMQQAGEDLIVSKEAAKKFFDSIQSNDLRRIEYPGYFHEIYNETPDRRGPVFEDLLTWLDSHR